MIVVRKSDERGHARHGWLESRHTFSFAEYHDPRHMGFRSLRVINEDRVQPGRGFERHSHRDMEIVSYVIRGGLEHGDSMGNGSVIRPGDVQLMRAGTGVTHSEFNASADEPVHFLQVWILPDRAGLGPAYEQKHFPAKERRGCLRLVLSADGRDGSMRIAQDVAVYASLLEAGQSVTHELEAGRGAWIQVVHGALLLDGVELTDGDGAAVTDESRIEIHAIGSSEFLLFDLAKEAKR